MLNLILVLQLLAVAVATWNYKKLTLAREKLFYIFLWYSFLNELTYVVLEQFFSIEAPWLYFAYTIISFPFYFYWFHQVLEKKILKVITLVFTALFLTLEGLAYVFPAELGQRGVAFMTGSISLLFLTFFHFYQLLRSNEVLIVKYKLSFWISTALLLFYMGIIPLVLLANYLGLDKSGSYNIILISLNAVLYGCYIIGFIWMKKKYSRS